MDNIEHFSDKVIYMPKLYILIIYMSNVYFYLCKKQSKRNQVWK